MKDEEIADKHAEEYRKNFRYYRAWHGQVVDKSPSTIVEQSFKDGFLAGLKAGRPQWHRPSEKLPKTTVLNEDGIKVYYDYDIKCWRYDDADEYLCDTPIAWCEIPTFDKETDK